jgi:hypothetical protein
MIDLSKEIIFRDGVTFDDGIESLTEKTLGNVGYLCELGQHFGLSLSVFEVDFEGAYFEWRGTKKNVLRFYTYYSKNMTTESLEVRKATLKIILNK